MVELVDETALTHNRCHFAVPPRGIHWPFAIGPAPQQAHTVWRSNTAATTLSPTFPSPILPTQSNAVHMGCSTCSVSTTSSCLWDTPTGYVCLTCASISSWVTGRSVPGAGRPSLQIQIGKGLFNCLPAVLPQQAPQPLYVPSGSGLRTHVHSFNLALTAKLNLAKRTENRVRTQSPGTATADRLAGVLAEHVDSPAPP